MDNNDGFYRRCNRIHLCCPRFIRYIDSYHSNSKSHTLQKNTIDYLRLFLDGKHSSQHHIDSLPIPSGHSLPAVSQTIQVIPISIQSTIFQYGKFVSEQRFYI